jgi:hypothetical protein
LTALLSAWTDGLQSNLLSEFCGFLLSITATYLILDRLIERNRKRHYQPLKRSLHRAVGQNLAAITHLWAFTLDKANSGDLKEALGRSLPDVIADLSQRIEADIHLLETSEEARTEFIARAHVSVDEIAKETFEDIKGMQEIAANVSQVVYDNVDLEQMIAELASDARALDHIRSFAEYLVNVRMEGDAPLDLMVVVSLRCYRRAQTLWDYIEELAAKGSH